MYPVSEVLIISNSTKKPEGSTANRSDTLYISFLGYLSVNMKVIMLNYFVKEVLGEPHISLG